jgi:hypothetical protein
VDGPYSRHSFAAQPAMGTDPLSPLRLRFAADNGSVPKAPVSCSPRVDRGVDPYNAWRTIFLKVPTFYFLLSSFCFPLPQQPRASAASPHSSLLPPHYFPFGSASLRTMGQSPRLPFPALRGSTEASTPTTPGALYSSRFQLSTFYFLLSAFPYPNNRAPARPRLTPNSFRLTISPEAPPHGSCPPGGPN